MEGQDFRGGDEVEGGNGVCGRGCAREVTGIKRRGWSLVQGLDFTGWTGL